jgi:hypothetical protein
MFQLQAQMRSGIWVPVGPDSDTREEIQTRFDGLVNSIGAQLALARQIWQRIRAVEVK